MPNKTTIKELLQLKADLQARLNVLPYVGTPEVKELASGKYLYMRKRELGKLKSVYVDKYSQELYDALLRYSKEAKELNRQIRKAEKELSLLGYVSQELPANVILNLEFARINMKANIYDQAILEGVATTYPQTETIIDNGIVSGMKATDVQKILNLKHAWEFILDKDVIMSKTDYYVLSAIAKIVNEGFYYDGGKIRSVPVKIGGSTYTPPIPYESAVIQDIFHITTEDNSPIEIAISICLYCMKTQIFNDGNKRAAVIFANHYLIGKGQGLLVIPEQDVEKFKRLLVDYYEGQGEQEIRGFMLEKCWRKI